MSLTLSLTLSVTSMVGDIVDPILIEMAFRHSANGWWTNPPTWRMQRAAPVLAALGYPVAREHICGVRLQEQEGRFTENLMPDYPQPIAEGKSELIRSLLPRQPILVAGDSANDLPMLTAFENTQVRLLLHRPGKGLDALYGDALIGATHGPDPVGKRQLFAVNVM